MHHARLTIHGEAICWQIDQYIRALDPKGTNAWFRTRGPATYPYACSPIQ